MPDSLSQAETATSAGQEAIFVLGMSRSGTSAVTRVLSLCGGTLPRHVLPSSNSNPSGYWEPMRAKEVNDAFLAAHFSSWSDATLQLQTESVSMASRQTFIEDIAQLVKSEFAAGQTILLKDPRIATLFPFWRGAMDQLGFSIKIVQVFRHPNDVAASLKVRDRMPAALAQALWLKANLISERDGRCLPRVFISYADVLQDWERVINSCIDALNLRLRITAETRSEVANFLDKSLCHHETAADDLIHDTSPGLLVNRTYDLLMQARYGHLNMEVADVIRGEYQTQSFSSGWPGPIADAWRLGDPVPKSTQATAASTLRLISNDAASATNQAAEYWSTRPPVAAQSRWWAWPRVIAFQNELVCGRPIQGWNAGLIAELRRRCPDGSFNRAVSVRSGNGAKEMTLLKEGLVREFHLFEISADRIVQGQAAFGKAGLSDRAHWHQTEDGLVELAAGAKYDLVFWDNALYHMPDTFFAIRASFDCLNPGGAFVMNDFVGASRFQWSDRQLRYASQVRQQLPRRFLRDPNVPKKQLPRDVVRPDITRVLAADPSAAADSERILEGIKLYLNRPQVWLLGGTIYHLALNDVLANFDPVIDAALLDALLALEKAMIELGETHYAACISIKPP